MTRGNSGSGETAADGSGALTLTPGGAVKPGPDKGSDALSFKDECSGFLGAAARIYRRGRLLGAAGFFGVEVLVGL